MPTCLRNWKAIARGYGSKLFSHEDFCCPKCTHMKPGLLLIKIVDETRDLFWAVVSRRFPEGSCAEGKHSKSVSARQCASTLDRHTGSGMAGGKKWKQGMQENTCNRLWECLDISSGIRKRKKKEGRNEKGKKRGWVPELQQTSQTEAQHDARGAFYLVFPVWPSPMAVQWWALTLTSVWIDCWWCLGSGPEQQKNWSRGCNSIWILKSCLYQQKNYGIYQEFSD